MKEFCFKIFKIIIYTIILSFVVIFVWAALIAMLRLTNENLSDFEVTIVAAIISGIISVVTIVITKNYEHRSAVIIEKRKNNQKIYIKIIEDLLTSSSDADKSAIKKKYEATILIMAEQSTVKEFENYVNGNTENCEFLIKKIRKEIGFLDK